MSHVLGNVCNVQIGSSGFDKLFDTLSITFYQTIYFNELSSSYAAANIIGSGTAFSVPIPLSGRREYLPNGSERERLFRMKWSSNITFLIGLLSDLLICVHSQMHLDLCGACIEHEIIVLLGQVLIRSQLCSPCRAVRIWQVLVLDARTQMI